MFEALEALWNTACFILKACGIIFGDLFGLISGLIFFCFIGLVFFSLQYKFDTYYYGQIFKEIRRHRNAPAAPDANYKKNIKEIKSVTTPRIFY